MFPCQNYFLSERENTDKACREQSKAEQSKAGTDQVCSEGREGKWKGDMFDLI